MVVVSPGLSANLFDHAKNLWGGQVELVLGGVGCCWMQLGWWWPEAVVSRGGGRLDIRPPTPFGQLSEEIHFEFARPPHRLGGAPRGEKR